MRERPTAPATVAVADLARHVGATVVVRGWLREVRSRPGRHALRVRDGTGVATCHLAAADVDAAAFARAGRLTRETVLEVAGVVRPPRGRGAATLAVRTLAVHAEPTA